MVTASVASATISVASTISASATLACRLTLCISPISIPIASRWAISASLSCWMYASEPNSGGGASSSVPSPSRSPGSSSPGSSESSPQGASLSSGSACMWWSVVSTGSSWMPWLNDCISTLGATGAGAGDEGPLSHAPQLWTVSANVSTQVMLVSASSSGVRRPVSSTRWDSIGLCKAGYFK